MQERLSVGTTFWDSAFVTLVILSLVGLIGGIVVMTLGENLLVGGILIGVAVLLGLFALVRGTIVSRGRRWMTATADGFVFEDRNGEFEFRDDDIIEMGTWAKIEYSNGLPKSVQRTGTFILSAGEFRGDLNYSYTYNIEKTDPMAAFLERNLERLTQSSLEKLSRGEQLLGDEWELDQKELTFTADRSSEPYRIDQMTAAEVVDDKVSIWIRGEPKPVVQVPAGGLNALLMLRILNKKLADHGPRADENEPGLGRIIFERDHGTSHTTCIVCWIIGGLFALGGLITFVVGAISGGDSLPAMTIGGVVFLIGLIGPYLIWINRVNQFRCHYRGVCKTTTKGTKQLEYKDVRVFNYTATRQYVNGAYTGTTVAMSFQPSEETAGDNIDYSATMKTIDAELDNLREHVSIVIASHMKQRLDSGADVRWTKGMTFTPEGLDVQVAGGILSKAKNHLLAYSECAVTLHEGYFFLFSKGDKDSLYSIPVSESNFFPGYILLCRLAYPPSQEAPTESPVIDEDDDPRPKRRRVVDDERNET